MAVKSQLRLYTIRSGMLLRFAEEWKTGVLPLRTAYGFKVGAAWTIAETNQFAWLLSYDGADSWEARERAYYVSPERKSMDPNPARLIERAEEYFVEAVL